MPGSERQRLPHTTPTPSSHCADYPHLYINLDRHEDRVKTFETENQAAITTCNIQRLSAIDGVREYEEPKPGELKRGEQGCIASHKKAWQHIVDSGAAFGVVMEDDAKLAEDYVGASDAIMAEAAEVCQQPLVYLDRTTWTDTSAEPKVSDHLHRVQEPSYGSHAYVISREAAEHLGTRDVTEALDVFISNLVDSEEVCLLRTSSSLASVKTDSTSSTQEV